MTSNDGHSARYANAAMLSNRAKSAKTKVRSGNQENTTESLNLLQASHTRLQDLYAVLRVRERYSYPYIVSDRPRVDDNTSPKHAMLDPLTSFQLQIDGQILNPLFSELLAFGATTRRRHSVTVDRDTET